jgi:hypothetical protein
MAKNAEPTSRYDALIEAVFFAHYKKGAGKVRFIREEFAPHARRLGIKLPKNLGDILYSYRFARKALPQRILDTCGEGQEWVIQGAGAARYVFRKVPEANITPRQDLYRIKLPDATPEIVSQHELSDEQALLAKVRYNRLIDIFLGVTAYSLQNHLRTHVKSVGQIEVDELYAAVNKSGAQFIVPVQAKGGRDKIGVVQIQQDIAFCRERFADLICRSVAAQFITSKVIAMFELAVSDDRVRILEERHYDLVPSGEIRPEDLRLMARDQGYKKSKT